MFVTVGKGRFTSDPELKEISKDGGSDTCVCNFTLAVDEFRGSGESKVKTTHFFDFEVWDSAARTIATYCKKGDTLFVRAKARQNKWDSPDGPRSKVVFRVEEFSMHNRNRDDSSDQEDE